MADDIKEFKMPNTAKFELKDIKMSNMAIKNSGGHLKIQYGGYKKI